jgi:hypothetical protein
MLPTLIIFQGGISASDKPLERLVARAQNASSLYTIRAAAASRSFERAVLVTEDEEVTTDALALALELKDEIALTVQGAPFPSQGAAGFNFGENLRAVCEMHGLKRVVYTGGGAMPLATPGALADLALAVSGTAPCVVSNNLFSADFVAFYPASMLGLIGPAANDNDLAWLLHYKGGLPHATTPKTLANNFDIDTPSDLATLHLATRSAPLEGAFGEELRALLERVPGEMPTLMGALEKAYEIMATRRAQVLLAGRVSSWTWRRLEANLPCQTRIFSEERGMRASGREARGEVRSLLGLYSDIAGIDGLMSALEQTSDAAFLDTRVLFAHRRLSPSRADRFASDAMLPEQVSDPWVRELTAAAASARIPVVLGGHSLVSGGVWAMSERVRGSASAAPV